MVLWQIKADFFKVASTETCNQFFSTKGPVDDLLQYIQPAYVLMPWSVNSTKSIRLTVVGLGKIRMKMASSCI